MSNGNGHRWSKFWWQDWQADKALRTCSIAARGLWMELLCIAHDGCPAGHVVINGVAPSPVDIAAMAGKITEKEVVRLLAELEGKGVFSRTTEGIIFSRRMVRDAVASEEGAKNISKRWANGKNPHPPNRGGNSPPISDPSREAIRTPTTLEADSESEAEPPRRSPASGGPARRGSKPSRNAFHDLGREFEAEQATRAATIDGTAEEVADLQAFRRRLAGGANG
jgi:hypothetical protein